MVVVQYLNNENMKIDIRCREKSTQNEVILKIAGYEVELSWRQLQLEHQVTRLRLRKVQTGYYSLKKRTKAASKSLSKRKPVHIDFSSPIKLFSNFKPEEISFHIPLIMLKRF